MYKSKVVTPGVTLSPVLLHHDIPTDNLRFGGGALLAAVQVRRCGGRVVDVTARLRLLLSGKKAIGYSAV